MSSTKNGMVDSLRKLYRSLPAAQAMLDYFASFQRNRSVSKVDNVVWNLQQNGHDVSRADVVSVFKELEQIGCGRYVPGRWSHPSRFEWSTNLSEVGKAASGEDTTVDKLPQEEITSEAASDEEPDMITHPFQLRRNLRIVLELPHDLTGDEAQRIATFLQSLPFNRAV
jgi:hypothetical protein